MKESCILSSDEVSEKQKKTFPDLNKYLSAWLNYLNDLDFADLMKEIKLCQRLEEDIK